MFSLRNEVNNILHVNGEQLVRCKLQLNSDLSGILKRPKVPWELEASTECENGFENNRIIIVFCRALYIGVVLMLLQKNSS